MKIFISVILAALVVLGVCFSSGCKKQENATYIAIISAMDNEIADLLKKADIKRVDNISGGEYHVGTLCGKNVVITKAGIGKIRTSSGATKLFENYDISKVIFTGIAGGVSDETKVLDEVIATDLVEHDYGIIMSDGFIWRSGDPGYGNEEGLYYHCDETLVNLAYTSAVEVLGADHVFKGTIATGDQFVASESYVEKLKNDYNALACEMEGAAVAVVCENYGKPYVVLRALSDKADGKAHESYSDFANVAADNSCKIVLKLLEKI